MIILKEKINNLFRKFGYQLIKVPYSDRKIRSGHYKWLQDLGIKTVFDIGANEGQFIDIILRLIPQVQVYSFEPLKELFLKLSKKFNGNKNVKLFNLAIGNKNSLVNFYSNEFSPSSSFLEISDLHIDAFPHTKNVNTIEVEMKTLDEMMSQCESKEKVLLKIDVQGYELLVLEGAERFICDVDIIIVESSYYELYKDQPLFEKIYQFLNIRGFKYFGNLEQIYDERDGKILQSDSIFIKR